MRGSKLWTGLAVATGMVVTTLVVNTSVSGADEVVARASLIDIYGRKVGKAKFVSEEHVVVATVEVKIDNAVTGNTSEFHGFHIHANATGAGCVAKPGNQSPAEWFTEVGGHWDDGTHAHGAHLGDHPSLLRRSDGTARMQFTLDKYLVPQLPGRALIVHFGADDFGKHPTVGTSATTGNAGPRYACGAIWATSDDD